MSKFRPVRRSQAVTSFGVGAMVNFPNRETLMTAGLDVWPNAFDECPPEWCIREERLEARLGKGHFRLPPDYRRVDIDPVYVGKHVPYVRFPRWHFCPDPRCGEMRFAPLFGDGVMRCQNTIHQKFQPILNPVRFVAICKHGHIEDFPFLDWVHRGNAPDAGKQHKLKYKAGNSASLAGIRIQCSCGQSQSMGSAFTFDETNGGALHKIGHMCSGSQPWLGKTNEGKAQCTEFLRTVQRGGSNVYYPDTMSSIYLPLWAEEIDPNIIKILEDPVAWGMIESGSNEDGGLEEIRIQTIAGMRRVDADALMAASLKKIQGHAEERSMSEEDYRYAEYTAFSNERGGEGTDLLSESVPISEFEPWVSDFFEGIFKIRKLRETRALKGFTRVLPPDSADENVKVQKLHGHSAIDWLPAIVVRGEGLFFRLNEAKLNEWVKQSNVTNRIKSLENSNNESRRRRGLLDISLSPKFILIHTLAHILIRQLSFDCGYGSSSLRERIYCDTSEGKNTMQGVLIYTASGDSEGTLGGLVRAGQAGSLENTILAGLNNAGWCSADPVCMESVGQGADNSNLAACHGCALLPETSCEEGNRQLDRAMLTGSMDDPSIGYFSEILIS